MQDICSDCLSRIFPFCDELLYMVVLTSCRDTRVGPRSNSGDGLCCRTLVNIEIRRLQGRIFHLIRHRCHEASFFYGKLVEFLRRNCRCNVGVLDLASP
jgi:hypothetical protein